MKSKACPKVLIAFVALAMMPTLAMAQNAGFRVGIAQPAFGFPPGFPPQQPPALVTNRMFYAVPSAMIPPPPVFVQIPAVIVPQFVLGPGQTFVQQPIPFVQIPMIQPSVPFSAGTFVPIQAFGTQPVQHFAPVPGTPRADVIRQYGAPSVTVITSSGETLHFTGGVTVIIQNGHVTGPR